LRESPVLRRKVFNYLSDVTGAPHPSPKQSRAARLDVAPFLEGKYPDVAVAIDNDWRWVIECKVGAPDNLQQLEEYRDRVRDRSRDCNLIYLTKHKGSIPAKALAKLGVSRIRWQDIHGIATTASLSRSPKDAFLSAELAKYLEDQGMAQPAKITRKSVEAASKILSLVSASGSVDGSVQAAQHGFLTLSYLTDLLWSIRDDLLERVEDARELSTWGPGYWKYFSKSDKKMTSGHRLGVTIYFATRYDWKNAFGYGFCLTPKNETFYTYIHVNGDSVLDESQPLNKICRGQLLDRSRLLDLVVNHWNDNRKKIAKKIAKAIQ
jgi:hypothetical protein